MFKKLFRKINSYFLKKEFRKFVENKIGNCSYGVDRGSDYIKRMTEEYPSIVEDVLCDHITDFGVEIMCTLNEIERYLESFHKEPKPGDVLEFPHIFDGRVILKSVTAKTIHAIDVVYPSTVVNKENSITFSEMTAVNEYGNLADANAGLYRVSKPNQKAESMWWYTVHLNHAIFMLRMIKSACSARR